MLFSLFIFFYSFKFPKFNREGTLPVGPRFYPQIIGIGLFISGLLLAIKNKPIRIEIQKRGIKDNLKIILLFTAYIIFFEILGYLISTFIFILCLLYAQQIRKVYKTIIFSVIVAIALYVTFYTILKIPLPGGILGHRFF